VPVDVPDNDVLIVPDVEVPEDCLASVMIPELKRPASLHCWRGRGNENESNQSSEAEETELFSDPQRMCGLLYEWR